MREIININQMEPKAAYEIEYKVMISELSLSTASSGNEEFV